MFQDQRCGQCNLKYTQNCKIIKKCQFHKGNCFQCANCSSSSIALNSKKCNKCQAIFPQNQLYFDHQCNEYFCRYEFLKKQQVSGLFQIPCKNHHTESIAHLYNYMREYCYWCGRKVIHREEQCFEDIIVCQLCLSSTFELQNKLQKKQEQMVVGQKQEAKNKNLQNCSQFQKLVVQQEELILSQNKANEMINQQIKNQLSNCKQIIQVLKQDLRISQDQRKIQYLSKKNVQKIVLNSERIIHCSICLIDFHYSDNPPYMVCLRQHLLCGKCYPSQEKCPQCSLKLDKQNILPSRLKINLLQLQSIVSKKCSQTVKQFKEKLRQLQEKQNLLLVKSAQFNQKQHFLNLKQKQIQQKQKIIAQKEEKQKIIAQKEEKLNQDSIDSKNIGISQRGRPKGKTSKK